MHRRSILLTCLWLIACDGGGDPADAGTDGGPMAIDAGSPPPDVSRLPTIDAANAVGPDHPLFEGQQRFLWDTFGTEAADRWPPADFFLQLMEDEPDVFGNQFESFGFVPDPDDELPVGFKRGLDDPTRVDNTCALCHVGTLPDGRLWIGAPTRTVDYGAFQVAVNERWVAAGNEPLLSELEAEKLSQLGPGRTGAESGDYPQVVPADFPPYYSLGERTALNYLGTARDLRTEVYLALFTEGAGDPNPREAVVPWPSPERLEPFLEFMGSLEPPDPPATDADLVARGRTIYEREGCDSCHHLDDPSALPVVTYDAEPDGRERMPGEDPDFPHGSIRTSALHRILVDGDGMGGGMPDEDRIAVLFRFITRNGLRTRMSDGYRAADLHGLWASAPYLHNGSVPTLEDLLRPAAERPATFERDGFVVDTTVAGNSNEGHEFGTAITEEERAALAEYLRSL
ncbi:MAG TPA: hypothetical protein RMH99_10660 [Sandaracinaceae bacterium LLY-WYZ-13_1]|nr:hypothetical protein [Sandaracinaceae bacterium LLY-WYZ-13_1]